MSIDERRIREIICEVGRRMYDKNLVSATDGNVSARLEGGLYLCTPSGVSKGFMQPDDIQVVDGKGKKVSGDGKVSSEFFTHLACYEQRPDIHGVVHAHPPKAIGLNLAGVSMTDYVLPEIVVGLGGVPTAPYATPGTPEGGEVIRELITQCDAVFLDRHGGVTVGVNVMDAYFKMEKIEHAAESLLIGHLMGKVPTLPASEVEKLFKVREDYGVSGKPYTHPE